MENKIREIVYASLEELNAYRSSESPLEINDSLILFGSGSPLDSLDLVSVITDVEEQLKDELSISLSLTDDHALAAIPSPYDSVKNLISFVVNNAV
jgi:acyl carrier protein